MTNYPYPAGPATVDFSKIEPSAAFKSNVTKVIGSIILFIIVYLALIAASLALSVVCIILGIKLITNFFNLYILLIGLGIIAIGLSVCYFLVKFIFATSKQDNATRVEITEAEQPVVFAFIKKLTEETQTPFPKKIFISADVNACVFYNSSFWSMLFPVRKNLEIGLGLVNSINLGEFKAVMAHEFGHFSQRSMKLGSFTYNVNRIIYNMLYENNSYTNFLNTWGNIDGILSYFALATYKIAQAIQWVLKEVYQVINKNYMALSRQMEFHADAVAASVAGGNNIISSLAKIEVAADCFNTNLSEANELAKHNKKAANLFKNHSIVFNHLANTHKIEIKNKLPQFTVQFIESFSRFRVNFKNQWASHPDLTERQAEVEKLELYAPVNEQSAWILFKDAETLQESMTQKLYETVQFNGDIIPISETDFTNYYENKQSSYTLPEIYKEYYDKRYVLPACWETPAADIVPAFNSTDSIFTDINTQLPATLRYLEADIATLTAIKNKEIVINSFDLDGKKIPVSEVNEIITQLETEAEAAKNKIKQLDAEIFQYYYNSSSQKETLINKVDAYKKISEDAAAYEEIGKQLIETILPFYHGQITYEQVIGAISTLKENHEKKLKQQLNYLQEIYFSKDNNYTAICNKIENFKTKDYVYFANEQFHNNELGEIYELTVESADAIMELKFKAHKDVLVQQLL